MKKKNSVLQPSFIYLYLFIDCVYVLPFPIKMLKVTGLHFVIAAYNQRGMILSAPFLGGKAITQENLGKVLKQETWIGRLDLTIQPMEAIPNNLFKPPSCKELRVSGFFLTYIMLTATLRGRFSCGSGWLTERHDWFESLGISRLDCDRPLPGKQLLLNVNCCELGGPMEWHSSV